VQSILQLRFIQYITDSQTLTEKLTKLANHVQSILHLRFTKYVTDIQTLTEKLTKLADAAITFTRNREPT